jgi:DNA-binding SARP family transcriptional activator
MGEGSARPRLLAIRVRVLGPIDLLTETGVIVPKGRIGRKLLGALAISVNHAVTADRLAEIIWHESPPPSLANTLQTYIYRLREEVGHERIVCSDHSYALRLAPEELDALEFEHLVSLAAEAGNDPSECIARSRKALGLWRGVPFGEFADEDPFRLETIRLDELRLYAMELKLAGELEIGREELVVGTLETLVEDYPFRERLWYLLIAALARSGRRVGALRAFHKVGEILGEVGLEPSEELRELEDDIISERRPAHMHPPGIDLRHD